ncbi:uncharacterized protein METZ01_LOCUS169290, partial [marine metagenome]
VRKHIPANRVITQVCIKSQFLIGLDSISSSILELISPNLINKANTAPFLTKVQQNPCTLLRDLLQGTVELGTTVAPHAEQAVAGQALG